MPVRGVRLEHLLSALALTIFDTFGLARRWRSRSFGYVGFWTRSICSEMQEREVANDSQLVAERDRTLHVQRRSNIRFT